MFIVQLTYRNPITEEMVSFGAYPADLTDYDNFAECASHFTNAQAADRPQIVAVRFSAGDGTVTFQLDDGAQETWPINPEPGELIAELDEPPAN